MRKKTRYFLLFTGFAAFFLIAPIIVLYARGVTFNFATHTFNHTGILAINSEPKNVDIFLNGQFKRKGAGNLRFMLPGKYQIELKKDGYFNWTKKLEVKGGRVTLANPEYKEIILFLDGPKTQTLEKNILDFYIFDGNLTFLSPNEIYSGPLNEAVGKKYTLPKIVDKILQTDDLGQNFVLINSAPLQTNKKIPPPPTILLFNSSTGKILDLTGIFDTVPKFQFDSSGNLYAFSKGSVYKIDTIFKTKTPLFNNVLAFAMLRDDLYSIQSALPTGTSTPKNQLVISQAPYVSSQPVITALPDFSEPTDLFVTTKKQILILTGNTLYLAGPEIEKLSENIEQLPNNHRDALLAFSRAGKLGYYDPANKIFNPVAQFSQTIKNPVINGGVWGAFFIKDNELIESELDTRGGQNQYVLYRGKNLTNFFVDEAGKNAWVLDDGELKSLVIR